MPVFEHLYEIPQAETIDDITEVIEQEVKPLDPKQIVQLSAVADQISEREENSRIKVLHATTADKLGAAQLDHSIDLLTATYNDPRFGERKIYEIIQSAACLGDPDVLTYVFNQHKYHGTLSILLDPEKHFVQLAEERMHELFQANGTEHQTDHSVILGPTGIIKNGNEVVAEEGVIRVIVDNTRDQIESLPIRLSTEPFTDQIDGIHHIDTKNDSFAYACLFEVAKYPVNNTPNQNALVMAIEGENITMKMLHDLISQDDQFIGGAYGITVISETSENDAGFRAWHSLADHEIDLPELLDTTMNNINNKGIHISTGIRSQRDPYAKLVHMHCINIDPDNPGGGHFRKIGKGRAIVIVHQAQKEIFGQFDHSHN